MAAPIRWFAIPFLGKGDECPQDQFHARGMKQGLLPERLPVVLNLATDRIVRRVPSPDPGKLDIDTNYR